MKFSFTAAGIFPPLAAFLGGLIAQEGIKAINQKWVPTQQWYIHQCF